MQTNQASHLLWVTVISFLVLTPIVSQGQNIDSLKKAADQGDAAAQLYLGACYYLGRSVAFDQAEAKKLFEKSASLNNLEAKKVINECFDSISVGGICLLSHLFTTRGLQSKVFRKHKNS
jgi:hypothetical protein